jgi:hypothetical protein
MCTANLGHAYHKVKKYCKEKKEKTIGVHCSNIEINVSNLIILH